MVSTGSIGRMDNHYLLVEVVAQEDIAARTLLLLLEERKPDVHNNSLEVRLLYRDPALHHPLVADYLVAHYVDHKEVGLIVRHTEDMHLLVAEGPVGQHLVLLVRYDRMVRLGTGHLGAERTDLCHNPWEVVERTD